MDPQTCSGAGWDRALSEALDSSTLCNRLHIPWPFSCVPSLPLSQPFRLAAFLAIVRASLVSYTYGIHCRLAFPEDFFGPSPEECRLLAESPSDCRAQAAEASVTPV
jgi:hypothetical protein